MPKPAHPVWVNFNVISKTGNSGKWAQCKKCKKELQGIPQRLLKHVSICCPGPGPRACTSSLYTGEPSTTASSHAVYPATSSDTLNEPVTKMMRSLSTASSSSGTLEEKIIVTSESQAKKIDVAIANYFYASNTPFLHADHLKFKEMITAIRPGYKPPTSRQLGGPLLEKSYMDTLQHQKNEIEGKTVSMSLDGWSNVHNEPIVCCSITTPEGQSILVDTIDTSGNPHTATYLKEVATNSITNAYKNLKVKVKSFVTDNAANVTKMRNELSKDNEDIIQYGCCAHMLNLLAQDVQIKGVSENIIKVVKYFRNKHLPASLYKAAGGKKLVMPIAVRWNTTRDCIRSYLANRGILVQMCQNNKSNFDINIIQIVNDAQITSNAILLLSRLDPIARALDRAQRDGTTISVAVEIWHRLENDLDKETQEIKNVFQARRDMALGSYHYLANILDHRFLGVNLNNNQRNKAFAEMQPDHMTIVTALLTQSSMFPNYLFGSQFKQTPPLEWWKLLNLNTTDPRWLNWTGKEQFKSVCEQLLSAVASTAGLERIFSTFGLVQSKIRNRLGTEKAHKLVYMFKNLNQSKRTPSYNMDWVCDPNAEELFQIESESQSQLDWDWEPEDDVPLTDLYLRSDPDD